jgi:uncharacterized RDD family membrane protein YckC
MSQIAPGWYPDPAAPTSPQPMLRWWDGSTWTDHVQPVGTLRSAPAPRPGPTTPDGRPLAGRGWRFLAWIVDGIALAVGTSLLTLPVQVQVNREMAVQQRELDRQIEAGGSPDLDAFFQGMFDVYADHVVGIFVIPALLGLAYYVGFLRWRGATLGKLATGLQVQPVAGAGRLSWGSILVRLFVYQGVSYVALAVGWVTGSLATFVVASLLVGIFSLVNVLWIFGPRRRALHDLAARTVVVSTR